MAFVKAALDDVEEDTLVPEGEYDLQVIKVDVGRSKKGNEMTTIMMKVDDPEFPNAGTIWHYLVTPAEDVEPPQRRMRLLDIKRFLAVFGVPMEGGGYDSDDLLGATGRALITQEAGDDGIIRNRIKPPRIK